MCALMHTNKHVNTYIQTYVHTYAQHKERSRKKGEKLLDHYRMKLDVTFSSGNICTTKEGEKRAKVIGPLINKAKC